DGLHSAVRGCNTLAQRDEALAALLRDHDKGAQLLSPMQAYNDFASKYDCGVSVAQPYWERNYPLGNKGIFRIRGMTSTLLSGPRDHEQSHKMLYGAGQRTLLREDNVYRAVVGHHPPSWTIEGDDADKAFSDRALIQLFGHKHEHWYTPAGKGVRLIAG